MENTISRIIDLSPRPVLAFIGKTDDISIGEAIGILGSKSKTFDPFPFAVVRLQDFVADESDKEISCTLEFDIIFSTRCLEESLQFVKEVYGINPSGFVIESFKKVTFVEPEFETKNDPNIKRCSQEENLVLLLGNTLPEIKDTARVIYHPDNGATEYTLLHVDEHGIAFSAQDFYTLEEALHQAKESFFVPFSLEQLRHFRACIHKRSPGWKPEAGFSRGVPVSQTDVGFSKFQEEYMAEFSRHLFEDQNGTPAPIVIGADEVLVLTRQKKDSLEP